jgi:hypothetical protein
VIAAVVLRSFGVVQQVNHCSALRGDAATPVAELFTIIEEKARHFIGWSLTSVDYVNRRFNASSGGAEEEGGAGLALGPPLTAISRST